MGSHDHLEGELLGVFFKSMVGSMLGADMLFPELAARVESLEDDGWYPFSEYCNALEQIEASLGPGVLRNAGMAVIAGSKEMFMEQGFDTLGKLLSAYPAMFDMNVRGVRDEYRVVLESYDANGKASFFYGAQQPASVIEGYYRGFFDIYDEMIDEISVERVDADRFRVNLTWTPS